MAKSAIILAGLLLGQPPVDYPSDPMWVACEDGEAIARVEGCAKIANDADFGLPARSWALVLRAVAHSEATDQEAAILDLDRAIRMQPQNWIAYRIRGDIKLLNEDLEAALADFDAAIEIAPNDPFNLLSRASYFRTKEDYETARQVINEAIALDPHLPDLYFERGRIALGSIDAEQAILDFEKYREMKPDDPATDYNLAFSYRMAGQLLDADAAINRVLAVTPDDATAVRQRAEIGLELGELDAALADAERAIELDPNDVTFKYTRGSIHSQRGEFSAAITDFTAVLPEYQNNAAILVDRGYAYFRDGSDENALADAEAALAIDPKSTGALWLKASALLYLERYGEAQEAVAQGQKVAPEDSRFPVLQGRALIAQDNSVGAIAVLSAAIEADPDSVDARIYRATAAANLGFVESARAELKEVLETAPSNGAALEQMNFVCRKAEDLECALASVGRLLEQSPEVPTYWWEKADILVGLKYHLSAPDAYQQAILLYGLKTPASLLRSFGASLIEVGRFPDAITAFRGALKKEPGDAWSVGEMGLAEHLAGQNDAAIVHLKRALLLYDGDRQGDIFQLHLADAYAANHAYRKALEEYDALLMLYPADAEALMKRGDAYRNLKEDHAASLAYADVGVRRPDFLNALADRIGELNRSGDRAAAFALVDKAVVAAPDASRPYFERAFLHREAGNLYLALSDLDRSLELEPGLVTISNNRADILLQMGNLEEAGDEAERVTTLHPEFPPGWVTLGQILLERGNLSDAIAALNKGVELNAWGAHFYRALANFRTGQMDAARRDLATASARDDGTFAEEIAELRANLSPDPTPLSR
jgi:tetratricopeptide (TPR) repeat protein